MVAGKLTRQQFKECLSDSRAGLTRTEINMCMALVERDEEDANIVNISDVGKLIEVRMCSLRTSMRNAASSELEKVLLSACRECEQALFGTQNGWIPRRDFRDVLEGLRGVRLTLMQIFIVASAPSDDMTGLLYYESFVAEAAAIIEQLHDVEVLQEKDRLMKRSEFNFGELAWQ